MGSTISGLWNAAVLVAILRDQPWAGPVRFCAGGSRRVSSKNKGGTQTR